MVALVVLRLHAVTVCSCLGIFAVMPVTRHMMRRTHAVMWEQPDTCLSFVAADV